jgi:hypothetical protein
MYGRARATEPGPTRRKQVAHFYGIVNGQAKTRATRRGTKTSGVSTVAASWEGAVSVELMHVDGQDWAVVCLEPWHGHGVTKCIYSGPVGEYKPVTEV